MKKLLLVSLLAMFTCISMWGATISVGTYSALTNALSSAAANDVIMLTADITDAGGITITKNLTIDGANHILKQYIIVNKGKSLTLKDVSVQNSSTPSDKCAILLNDGATLILSNASVEPKIASSPAVRTPAGANVTVRLADGTSNTFNCSGVHCFYASTSGTKGIITIEGDGTLIATQSGTTGNVFSANTTNGGSYIVNAPNAHFIARSAETMFMPKNKNGGIATGTLNAGTYNYEPSADKIGDGKMAQQIALGDYAGHYEIVSAPIIVVAQVGETTYQKFSDALAAVTAGGTIKLLKDIEEALSTDLTVSKDLTIDGQGYSLDKKIVIKAGKTLTLKDITVSNSVAGTSPYRAVTMENNAVLVLDGATIKPGVTNIAIGTIGANATIRAKAGSTNYIKNTSSGCLYIWDRDNSRKGFMTIEGDGTLYVQHTGTSSYVFHSNSGSGGEFTVTAPNAHFTAENASQFFYSKSSAVISAGTYSINPSNYLTEGCVVLPTSGNYKVIEINASSAAANSIVAVAGKTAYTSLSAAISAANAGETITLWANAASTQVGKSIVVKANGYNASSMSAASGYARATTADGYVFGKANTTTEGGKTVYSVSNFDEFWFAANYAAGNNDIIRFTADIAYNTNGQGLIDITKNITIEGQNHTFSGYGKENSDSYPAIGVNIASQSNETELTIKDLTISNPCKVKAYACRLFVTRGHVKSITLNNVALIAPNGDISNARGFHMAGDDNGWGKKTTINVTNSTFDLGNASYCITSYTPYELNAENSEFIAWNVAVLKDAVDESAGSRGSVLNFDNCDLNTMNVHNGPTNDFEAFSIQDDGIEINLNNCNMNAKQLGNQSQVMFDLNAWQLDPSRRENPVRISITGDNSNIQGELLEDYWSEGYDYNLDPIKSDDYKPAASFEFTVKIEGGTYGFNPNLYSQVIIPSGYEVNEVNTTQSGEHTTLYRVRKEIVSDTKLNDNEGDNIETEIKVTTSTTVANDETSAKYVEVTGSGVTVTVPEGKTLEVTNGMDVTEGAQLIVQPGSIVAVGEGGVISEESSNIVIEADETGAASFLLSPDVIVNTTPNLTVKMTTHVGTIAATGEQTWHRFAAPVANISSFSKNVADAATWIYRWDYSSNNWKDVEALSELVPFQGFTLSHVKPHGTEVVYTFTGELAGNTDNLLEFGNKGYNYFGNSYSGYIDVRQLLNKLDLDAIDASVWMWDQTTQTYKGVPIRTLQDDPSEFDDDPWKKEVAPMQTFILRWMNGSESPNGEISYSEAIWGNPRYSAITGLPAFAPARSRAATDNASVRVKVTAENGKADYIDFREADRFDDTYESGYDVSKYMNENTLNVYSTIDGEDCETVATNALLGKTISLQTRNDINYTLSFERVKGTLYAIKDMQTGIVTIMSAENTYPFTAQPNATTESRFMIVAAPNIATSVEDVTVAPTWKGIYTIFGQYVGDSAMWNSLPAGVYIVNGVKLVK